MVNNKKTFNSSTLIKLSKISIVALLTFTMLMNCASAQTLTVGPSEIYPTINSAVAVAVPGDTIIVQPGMYIEDVMVTTPDINIVSGSGNPVDTIVMSTSTSYPISAFGVMADNVNIEGFKTISGYSGVGFFGVNNCSVSNCIVSEGLIGIDFYNSNYCDADNNIITLSKGYGISVALSNYCNVSRNTISSSRDHGIIVAQAEYTTIDSNKLYNNGFAAVHHVGISHQRSNYSLVVSNNISNHEYGIQVDKTYNSDFYNNYFNNDQNVVFSNTNLGNAWNTTLTAGTNIIGGPYIGGNYWASSSNSGFSQTNTDADANGICDVQNVLDSDNIDYLPLKSYILPVGSVSDLKESDIGYTWINWSWTNPSSSNFDHSMIYLDGVFTANVSTEYFNVTALSDSTSYEIGIRTVDKSGNINTTWVNDTATTLDGTAPASVAGLSEVAVGYSWINWSWSNPSDVDFDHCDIYIDGIYAGTATSPYYNATGISQGTVCEIGIMTVDSSGNVNTNLITDSAKTDEQVVVTTVTSKSSGSSSSSNTGTELRIIGPDEEEDDSVADLEETPLQSTPEVYEEEAEMDIGASIVSEASDATETTSSAPGFGVLTAIGVMISMVLFRRKD